MPMNETELLLLKEKIDSAKTQVAEYEGEKKSILASLLERFGCKTLKEAEAKAAKMQEEIDNMQIDLDGGIAEIEKKYGEIQ